jgi:hypothetical protein
MTRERREIDPSEVRLLRTRQPSFAPPTYGGGNESNVPADLENGVTSKRGIS